MNIEQQTSFAYVSQNKPLYELGWQHVLPEETGPSPVWRVVIGDSSEAALYALGLHAEMATRWETYAGDVTRTLQQPVSPPSMTDQVAAAVPVDAVVGLFGYVARTLQWPLIIETQIDGALLAQTTVHWPDEYNTTWHTERFAPQWAEFHTQVVTIAGRLTLAVLQRETAVAAAIRRARKQGLDTASAWVAVQQLAATVPLPEPPEAYAVELIAGGETIMIAAHEPRTMDVTLTLQNSGSVPWGEEAILQIEEEIVASATPSSDSGILINGPLHIRLPGILPGDTIQVTVPITAQPGIFDSRLLWEVRAVSEDTRANYAGEGFIRIATAVGADTDIDKPTAVEYVGVVQGEGAADLSSSSESASQEFESITAGSAVVDEPLLVRYDFIVQGDIIVNAPLIVLHDIIAGGDVIVNAQPFILGHDLYAHNDLIAKNASILIQHDAYIGSTLNVGQSQLVIAHEAWIGGDLHAEQTALLLEFLNSGTDAEIAVVTRLLAQAQSLPEETIAGLLVSLEKIQTPFWRAKALINLLPQLPQSSLLPTRQLITAALQLVETLQEKNILLRDLDKVGHSITLPFRSSGKNPLEIEWCWVPGGPFAMGSDQYDDEKPIHKVEVDGFWLARFPVTNAQYRLFVEAGGYQERRWWSDAGWQWREKESITQPRYWEDSKWNGETQPVVGVSWYEAEAFCRWAAETIGEQIRLPCEAEWEKAARGTDQRKYPWGNNEPTDKLCNFTRNIGQTTPVEQYSPAGDSPYGCIDMAGNVYDWVNDWYADDYYRKTPDRNPKGPESGSSKVVRGGSWGSDAFFMRASDRNGFQPENRHDDVGFRCASTPF